MLYLSAQIKIIGRDVFCLPFILHHITPSFISSLFSLFHNQCEVFRVQSSCMFNTTDAAKWTGVELQLLC